MKLSVIIPAYNEEKRIGKTLEDIASFLSQQVYDSEVLVVVDGSPDHTADAARGYGSHIKNLRVIENIINKGKGGVVRQGILEARGDIRVFMDADNSTRLQEIAGFLPFFDQGYDIVLGSRRIAGSHVTKEQGALREFLGKAFRLLVHILVPVHVTDTQCGFKAFSASAAQKVFSQAIIDRWAFDVEILAIARRMGLQIIERPITWENDTQSKVKLSGMLRMLVEVVEVRVGLWTGKYKRTQERSKV